MTVQSAHIAGYWSVVEIVNHSNMRHSVTPHNGWHTQNHWKYCYVVFVPVFHHCTVQCSLLAEGIGYMAQRNKNHWMDTLCLTFGCHTGLKHQLENLANRYPPEHPTNRNSEHPEYSECRYQ